MYLEHFGLQREPFKITPSTDFYFADAGAHNVLDAIIYAALNEEGIIKVCGEIGTGKTMLCHMLLKQLKGRCQTVYLPNPALHRQELLLTIAEELGIAPTDTFLQNPASAIQHKLLEHHAHGFRTIALIDETQAMPAETLEAIRLLSNLETDTHKLLTLVLFGQPELDQRLESYEMRPLKDRITQHFQLEPIAEKDIPAYINFRLKIAGHAGTTPFSPKALQHIAQASGGYSRRINLLAAKSLLAAYIEGIDKIDERHVKAAIQDLKLTPLTRKHPTHHSLLTRWLGLASALILASYVVFKHF